MAFIPVLNTAQVELRQVQQGQHVENVFHVLYTADFDDGSLGEVAGIFAAWWVASLRPHVNQGVTLAGVVAIDLEHEDGAGIEYTTGLPSVGQVNAGDLPMNVTMAIKFGSARVGRSYRGRSYFVGLSENIVTGSTVDATFLNNIRNAYNTLIGNLLAADFQLVVVSRYTNNAPRTTGVSTPIISVSIEPTTDSQRRRLPGRGS